MNFIIQGIVNNPFVKEIQDTILISSMSSMDLIIDISMISVLNISPN